MESWKAISKGLGLQLNARPPPNCDELRPILLALQRQSFIVRALVSSIKCGMSLNVLETLPSHSEATQLCSLTYCGQTMHLPWILRLFNILSILHSLCILSSANPTSFPLAKGTARHELHLSRRSHPLDTIPAFPNIQPISKRSPSNGVSYNSWGNGWTSRSYTFVRSPPQKAAHLQIGSN